jgi:mRNA interferase YafQ
MRTIRYTARFKRDYKREKRGLRRVRLDTLLTTAVRMLAADDPLPRRYYDHPLSGE